MSYPAHIFDGAEDFCVHCDDTFTEDCADEGHDRLVTDADFHWVICDRCQGEGTLGGWPGAYTESDRAEWSDDDYEDYRTTRRACEDCGGTGKERVIHDEVMTRPGLAEWARDYYDSLAVERAERWAGA